MYKMLENIFYINLKSRPDRKEQVEKELYALSPTSNIRRIDDAVAGGPIGCAYSHITAIKLAQELKLPHICIVEDDIVFTNKELLLTNMDKFISSVPEWDVLMLAGNVCESIPIGDFALNVTKALCCAGYIVREHYYETLLLNFINGYQMLRICPSVNEYIIDVHWHRRQKLDLWFIIYPLTVTQRKGYSDIQKKYVDYDKFMLQL